MFSSSSCSNSVLIYYFHQYYQWKLSSLHLNISFPSIHYYLIDYPLPQSFRDWYDLDIRKNCYYPIYLYGNTQHLVILCFLPIHFNGQLKPYLHRQCYCVPDKQVHILQYVVFKLTMTSLLNYGLLYFTI